jgi:FkbM family methyltransferase
VLYFGGILKVFLLKKSTLIEYLLKRPHKWGSAVRLASGLACKRPTVGLASDGVWLFSGTSKGAGIWCALTGLDYEKELTQLLRLLRPGQVFVDIGANIGTYSIRASQALGSSGKVFAFEPLDSNRSRLLAGKEANQAGNVIVVAAAVGDRNATVTLHDAGRESSASLNHVTGRKFSVRMVSLDSFVEEAGLRRLDWIKMDIEGAEPLVVKGARKTIEQFKPAFLFENHEGGPETRRLLEGAGYRIGRLTENGILEAATQGTNLFAFHPDNPNSRGVGMVSATP